MASQLLTVRLAPEDERNVQALQDAGVNTSDVVRRAIREEAARLRPVKIDSKQFMAEVLRLHPEPLDAPEPDYPDTSDRRAVGEYILAQMRRS